jgi:predicted transposase YbfD/YdcC
LRKGGDYLLVVKGNPPTLLSDLTAAFEEVQAFFKEGGGKPLPWMERGWQRRGVGFDQCQTVEIGHGRTETRELWALADPEINAWAGTAGSVGVPWPHRSQVIRLKRERTLKGETRTQTTYLITSLSPQKASAADLLTFNRSYWEIENRLHWVRDVTFGEDHSQIRAGSAPQVKAALTNLALTMLRRQGEKNIAASLRTLAARPKLAVSLVLSAHLLQ